MASKACYDCFAVCHVLAASSLRVGRAVNSLQLQDVFIPPTAVIRYRGHAVLACAHMHIGMRSQRRQSMAGVVEQQSTQSNGQAEYDMLQSGVQLGTLDNGRLFVAHSEAVSQAADAIGTALCSVLFV